MSDPQNPTLEPSCCRGKEACDVRNYCAEACPHCAGTGDVHRADGEWLGACDCAAGMAIIKGGVPINVRIALHRMCTPLHPSVLSGATAEADARSMQVIRDYILRSGCTLAQLQRDIADDCARSDVECKALQVPSTWGWPVYDVTQLAAVTDDAELLEAYREDVAKAVRYLDLRGMLVRPIKGAAQFVSFGGGGAR